MIVLSSYWQANGESRMEVDAALGRWGISPYGLRLGTTSCLPKQVGEAAAQLELGRRRDGEGLASLGSKLPLPYRKPSGRTQPLAGSSSAYAASVQLLNFDGCMVVCHRIIGWVEFFKQAWWLKVAPSSSLG